MPDRAAGAGLRVACTLLPRRIASEIISGRVASPDDRPTGELVNRRSLARAGVAVSMITVVAGCTKSAESADTPGLETRGTVFTTVKATRQDIVNRISLAGKVGIDPVFGLVAPVDGEVRYPIRRPSVTPVTESTWVATVWRGGEPFRIEMPAGSSFAGRLMADHATVSAGMPIVSARHAGYGIVAEIDSAQAYRISSAVKSVRGQIKNGPGPFRCKALGTIAALPAGTIPEPPVTTPPTPAGPGAPTPPPAADTPPVPDAAGSESTGLRLVCTAPGDVKLINGAAVTLDVITDRATKALVLPVEAVAGTQGRGKVDVVGADRARRTVDVVLGLTDGKFVQIKSGLKGTETVAVPGPNLPAAPPGQDNGGQPSGMPG
jgi:hypothetical protein